MSRQAIWRIKTEKGIGVHKFSSPITDAKRLFHQNYLKKIFFTQKITWKVTRMKYKM